MTAVTKLRESADRIEADGTPSQVGLQVSELRTIADVLEQTRLDHENVLRAALSEPNGIDLTQRLTAYALSQRPQPE